MNILVITPSYPDSYSSSYPFVKQIVDQFAWMGHNCCVIAPYNIFKKRKLVSFIQQYVLQNNSKVIIIRPRCFSFSTINIFGWSPTTYFRRQAQRRALKHLPFRPDVVYCHFWRSGQDVFDFAYKEKIPLFIATGESVIHVENNRHNNDFYHYVRGVISVSTKNKEESIQKGMTTENKCVVLPNGINNNLFRLMNKEQCRVRLGYPRDAFICIFVGWFNERKGINRVAQAINMIQEEICSVFIGGDGNVECKNVLFKGRVPHEEIPSYLNAADVFVLPTLHEGCCNAIIEAMACGLPIISSNLPFNWDVLNDTNSILINPESIIEIRDAILLLKSNDKLRNKLSRGALKTASSLSIEKRAEKIISFIKMKS